MSIRRNTILSLVCVCFAFVPSAVNADKLYWRETQADDSGTVIKRSDLDGTNIEELVTIPTALTNPFGLALDLDFGKIYWAERENGKIRRANLDGSNPEDILTGLKSPLNIALDIPDGRIYWTQDELAPLDPEPGVYRSYLDGTGVEQLLAGDYWAIDLDLTNRKMYLTRTGLLIGPSSADLDGNNEVLLIDPGIILSVFGNTFLTAIDLDLDAGKMYFTAHTAGLAASSIGWADLDGSNPETILVDEEGEPVGYPLAILLDPDGGLMYWSDTLNARISRANTDGTEVIVFLDLSATGVASNLALDLAPEPQVPMLSEWGLATMTLLILTAGTLVYCRRWQVRPA